MGGEGRRVKNEPEGLSRGRGGWQCRSERGSSQRAVDWGDDVCAELEVPS